MPLLQMINKTLILLVGQSRIRLASFHLVLDDLGGPGSGLVHPVVVSRTARGGQDGDGPHDDQRQLGGLELRRVLGPERQGPDDVANGKGGVHARRGVRPLGVPGRVAGEPLEGNVGRAGEHVDEVHAGEETGPVGVGQE